MDIITCPSTAEIEQFLRGEIADPFAADVLSGHVSDCSRCSRTLKRVDGEFSDQFRRSPDELLQRSHTSAVGTGVVPPYAKPPSLRQALTFLLPAQEPDEIGRLAHYRILNVLGSGGMGVVLHAEDIHLNRPVALKVIKSEYSYDPETRKRFMREAQAMAHVKSDHVVTVYQVGEDNGTCFIAMELLEGEPLDSLMDRVRRLPLPEALRIGKEIAQALVAAHSRGVIHRDIKPANVWIEDSGRIKLLDFGLARPESSDIKLTATGLVMGTPAYMAPEQARAAATDERADLFSLGSLLYRLVCGEPPFAGDNAMALIAALIESTPAPPSRFNIEIPPALDELILQLLAKTPDGRPKSAVEVVARIEAIERALDPTTLANQSVVRRSRIPAFGSFEDDSESYNAQSIFKDGRAAGSGNSVQRFTSKREAEHRQVTMLACSCSLFESEDFIDHFDAEEQNDLLGLFRDTCERAVQAFDGSVVRGNDDSLLVCFGYPTAFEDAAVRATNAALSILEELRKVSDLVREERKVELSPWLVLNTGRAIVETKNGEITVVGEARNLAMRMKEVAGSGEVVCSDSTHQLLNGKFECTARGEHEFKSIANPVSLYQVHRLLEHTDPSALSYSVELTPLTGRDLEVSLLKARWEQTKNGAGQIVQLIGEAGLGKSRLVRELKHHIAEQSTTQDADTAQGTVNVSTNVSTNRHFVEWYCSPHFQNSGLYPVKTFFRRIFNLSALEESSARLAGLISHLERYNLAEPDTVALFASLLCIPTDERFPLPSLTPVREREETFRVIGDWLCAYSSERPVLFIIEDLNWIDSSTLEFLTLFLAERSHEQILTLITSRPDFQPPWAAHYNETIVALSPLTKEQVCDLLNRKTGNSITQSVIEQVYDRAGGVPLFIEESTKLAGETGLSECGNDDRFNSTIARVIPPTLQDLIMTRLERMDGDREVAQLAATLGREFSQEVFAVVTGLDAATLNSELFKLVRAEILHEKGRKPNATYIFKNPLLQDALYNSLVKLKRQQFHARIVDSLESRFPQLVEPEMLAHHAAEANLQEKAVHYWLAAGLRAQELFSNVDAIGHFKRGLDALLLLPESPERDLMELSLQIPLGSAYQAVLGYAAPDVGPTFARARDLCQKVGSPAELFSIMWGNWTWHLVRGELLLCEELADEMITYAEYTADGGMLMEACVVIAVTKFFRGDFSGCRKYCEAALSEYEDKEQCRLWSGRTGQNAAVVVRCYLSQSLWHHGYSVEAQNVNEDMLELAREIGHPFSLAHGLYFSSWLQYRCGSWDELQKNAIELTKIAIGQGFDMWRATGTFFEGAGLLDGSEPEKAQEKIEQGLKSFQVLSASLTIPAQLAVLASACIKNKRLPEAQESVRLGLVLADQSRDCSQKAELQCLMGQVALLNSNDSVTAEASFRAAMETARQQGSRALELRSAICLAELLERSGRGEEAYSILSTICGACPACCSTPDLVAARMLLRDLTT
ncbi:protein kinase [Candidatus Obscuribacterales bacterium]|nr:protein kinase [Candidatus Obscuribacterales bacterium]MBX3152660.1 protein kinase [Candidatus Obscuribacterales bacterium]